MRIIGKIIAVPFVIVLTILGGVLSFLFQLSSWIFVLISSILGLGGIGLMCTGDIYGGVGVLVIAFLLSPFGLYAIAEWIADQLDNLNYSLKNFITS